MLLACSSDSDDGSSSASTGGAAGSGGSAGGSAGASGSAGAGGGSGGASGGASGTGGAAGGTGGASGSSGAAGFAGAGGSGGATGGSGGATGGSGGATGGSGGATGGSGGATGGSGGATGGSGGAASCSTGGSAGATGGTGGTVAPCVSNPSKFVAVSAGGIHTCAVTTAGAAVCWGNNDLGQLGDGTKMRRQKPTQVSGLTSGVIAVAAGASHSCALTSAGGVKCWGSNGWNQLGDNTNVDHIVPADVAGLTSGIAAISAGAYHTCARTTAGGLKCWGQNTFGQLGDGTETATAAPVDVIGLNTGVGSFAAGSMHTCAVTATGGVKCWGNNNGSQLGISSIFGQPSPADVTGLGSGVSAIVAGGYHTCALTTSNGVKCWGQNYEGQLGDGSATVQSANAVDVTGLTSGVSAISAQDDHTCALLTSGALKCWGSNKAGEIGHRSITKSGTPLEVWNLTSGISALSTGGLHTCALTSTGQLRCWGENLSGQLGDGTSRVRNSAVDHAGLSGVAGISSGTRHGCAVTSAGGVKCWGHNGSGELGNGTTMMSSGPVTVTGLTSGVTAVKASVSTEYGGAFSCALTSAGGLKCWGSNSDGQLGDGTTTDHTTPVDVTGLTTGVASFTVGATHACAVTTAGAAKCWGNGFAGQLGNAGTSDSSTPVDVQGLGSGVAVIAAAAGHTCALLTSGGVKCWGLGDVGQTGHGVAAQYPVPFPADVKGLSSGVTAIVTAHVETCALTSAGTVKCWGASNCKTCSWSDPYCKEVCGWPGDVPNLPACIVALTAGAKHQCVLTSQGGVKCWGPSPSGVVGPAPNATGYTALSAGGTHTCGLLTTGDVRCWGDDEWGLVSGTFGWAPRMVCDPP